MICSDHAINVLTALTYKNIGPAKVVENLRRKGYEVMLDGFEKKI